MSGDVAKFTERCAILLGENAPHSQGSQNFNNELMSTKFHHSSFSDQTRKRP